MGILDKKPRYNVKKSVELIGDFEALIDNDVAQLKHSIIEGFSSTSVPVVNIKHPTFHIGILRGHPLSELTYKCIVDVAWENGPTELRMYKIISDITDDFRQRICDQSPFKETIINIECTRTYTSDHIVSAANRVNQYLPKPYLIPLNVENIHHLMYENQSLYFWAICDLKTREL